MANELRKRQISIGGLVEDNPLTSGATTLTSASLAAVNSGVASDEHMAIVLDPDGMDGAPEVAYVTALTALAGSATVARGQEGTSARAHAKGTPWVHAPTVRDVVRTASYAHVVGTSLALTSASWANLSTEGGYGDADFDIILPAFAGDIIEYTISSIWDNEGVSGYLDVQTRVAAAAVSWFGSTEPTPTTGNGTGAWFGASGVYTALGGTCQLILSAGDISSGTVTLRPRYRGSTAGTKTLNADTTMRLKLMAKNLGPPSAIT